MNSAFRYMPLGDSAFIIQVGDSISEENHSNVMGLKRMIEASGQRGIIEVVPAYCDLVVHYDPSVIQYVELLQLLKSCEAGMEFNHQPDGEIVEIPVRYGGEMAMDLEELAIEKGMSPQEICEIHSGQQYRVYMIGFMPGFAYLGGLDQRLHAERLKTPRIRIPAGSVGIAGSQTGIYPLDSPGGWRIIGRTPVRLFDPVFGEPFLLKAGDIIKFRAISGAEFTEIQRAGDE